MTTRRHRRAVGPPGAPAPTDEPIVEAADLDRPRTEQDGGPGDDDERLRADRPPHHDREH